MQKHANTFFPGDTVIVTPEPGTKLSSAESTGKIIGGDPDAGTFTVLLDNGSTDYIPAHKLTKT
jgi:hypothetical protein